MKQDSKIFLMYSFRDEDIARTVMNNFIEAGISHNENKIRLGPDKMPSSRLVGLGSNDYLVLLLSEGLSTASNLSEQLEYTINKDWRQQAVTIVPVKVEPCDVPDYLKKWLVIDAIKNFDSTIEKLTKLLGSAGAINFNELSPLQFENMVFDLLKSYRFRTINRSKGARDYGYDFTARSNVQDPFGRPDSEEWIIEVKALSRQTDVSALHSFLGTVSLRGGNSKGLFITSGQLTSIAREWLAEVEKSGGPKITVLEGAELRRLILPKHHIISKYFTAPAGGA